ncbi:MAG: hypothetical protein AB8F74_01390 [Saprospiraceae bacterium]
MAKKTNNKSEKNPKVHDELDGFNMKINSFGEITSNFEVDKINAFLDENVKDKKFVEREESQSKGEEE